MAEAQDIDTLRRRGRRRLVGAIALVLLAVIVLPMVFDTEPKPLSPPVSVRIPSEDGPEFAPKVTPKLPPEPGPAPQPAPAEPAKPEAKAAERTAPEKKAPDPEAERKRAEAALAGGEQFVVPVGAFADPEKIKEVSGKLRAAKVPYYTEQVPVKSGMLTRVRAGPFATREAAQSALQKMKKLGLKPGNVAARS